MDASVFGLPTEPLCQFDVHALFDEIDGRRRPGRFELVAGLMTPATRTLPVGRTAHRTTFVHAMPTRTTFRFVGTNPT